MPTAFDTPHAHPDPFVGLDVVMSETIKQRLLLRAAPWRTSVGLANGGRKIARLGTLPGRRRMLAVRSVCGIVRMIVGEMLMLIGPAEASGRDCRFALSHIQQMSFYVCHVVLQLTMTEIGQAVGRDRTTVGHACARVEDRRDDQAYDRLIAAIERVIGNVFAPIGRRQP